MAEQPNVYSECLLLDEFVADAGGAKPHAASAEAGAIVALREVVQQIGAETGVPRFKMAEVVDRVVASLGTEIEDLIRQQIRMVLREYRPEPSPKLTEKSWQGVKSEEASPLPL